MRVSLVTKCSLQKVRTLHNVRIDDFFDVNFLMIPQHPSWISLQGRVENAHISNFSSDPKQKEFLNTLAKQLNIYSLNDWYTVRLSSIVKNGGSSLLVKYHDSIYRLLNAVYPEYLLWYLQKLAYIPWHKWIPENFMPPDVPNPLLSPQRITLNKIAQKFGILLHMHSSLSRYQISKWLVQCESARVYTRWWRRKFLVQTL